MILGILAVKMNLMSMKGIPAKTMNVYVQSVMDKEYGQQLDTYCDQPDCTSPEEQMQDNEWNEEMDNQIKGLNAKQNDEGLDDGKQNDDWNEEAENGEMGKADEQGVESINDEQGEDNINDEQGEDNISEDDFPLYPGASISFKVTMILLLAFITQHNLTNEAISDLLYIINLICPITQQMLQKFIQV